MTPCDRKPWLEGLGLIILHRSQWTQYGLHRCTDYVSAIIVVGASARAHSQQLSNSSFFFAYLLGVGFPMVLPPR